MGERTEPEIRVLESEAELREASALFRTAMVGLPSWPEVPDGTVSRYLEAGRTWGAFLDGMLVGTVDATSGNLTLPGGARVPHAAVTHIGVLPTHTRRGVISGLVHRQLSDARDRGEILATLRASEATIYGRFGYGVASTSVSVDVDVRGAALRPDVPEAGAVRLLTYPDAWDVLAQIHSRHLPPRPGMIDRSEYWWNSRRWRADSLTDPMYVAVHGEPGQEDGFVRYHPVDTQAWFTSRNRTVVVDDFFAPSPEAYAGLLRFLLGLDLVDTLRFMALPQDDPMPLVLGDARAVQFRSVSDETWLRILDLDRALSARSYRGSGSVTVEVSDPVLTDNAGVVEISAGGAVRTTGPADLAVDIADLGALLLGRPGWSRMAAAGRVRVRRPEAVDTADLLFSWPNAPFAGTSF
ncbi:acetyltransferase [Rhodococcus gordoniae]|uniref:Acetyltransferase n=1 Tax=Rhodococcus gordoniae TaxID=223392 RepID=A0A379M4G7_9NOCA|nr:GNAT family N-acetyltransferase [Rhodococcus gordoniae]SUE17211.1 acetyltransferase [Rhodococcus gordoniae]